MTGVVNDEVPITGLLQDIPTVFILNTDCKQLLSYDVFKTFGKQAQLSRLDISETTLPFLHFDLVDSLSLCFQSDTDSVKELYLF